MGQPSEAAFVPVVRIAFLAILAACGREKPSGESCASPASCPGGGGGAAGAFGGEGARDAGPTTTDGPPGCAPSVPVVGTPGVAPWSRAYGDSSYEYSTMIRASVGGGLYVAVRFFGSLDLGGGSVQSTNGAVVVAKLDATGRHLWSRQLKQANDVAIHDLREGPDGSLVVGGSFAGTVDFGQGAVTADGDRNAFLAAWDACGVPAWSKQLGAGPFAAASIDSLGRDQAGDVVVAGTFGGAIDLGAGPFTTRTYWDTEAFIARFTAAGTFVWNKRLGAGMRGVALAVDAAGNTHVAGTLDGTIDLGAGPIAADGNVFGAKLDPEGGALWTLVGRGARTDDGSRAWIGWVSVDGVGNLIIGGGFTYRSVDLGQGVSLDYQCCEDNAFVAKIDRAGQALWIRSLPGAAPSLIAASDRTVVVATPAGYGFQVQELDAAGTQKSLRVFGKGNDFRNASEVQSVAVATDGSDAILLSGNFSGTLDLGQGPLTVNRKLLDVDVFVARLADVTSIIDAGVESDGLGGDAGSDTGSASDGPDASDDSDGSGGDARSDVPRARDGGAVRDGGVSSGPARAVEIRAGEYDSCAALDDGRFVCWGIGLFGNGNAGDGRLALALIGLTDVVDLSLGQRHACALTGDQFVWCWGYGSEDQVPNPSASPKKIATLRDVLQISADMLHTCVVRADQTVWCWGWNNHAEVSPSHPGATSSPVPVADVGAAAKVVAGGINTCALLVDRTVRCWGDNSLGQTGAVDVTSQRFMPVAQPDIAHVKDLALGWKRACALLEDSTVSCWGRNDEGGAYGPRPSPVAGLSGVAQIGVGEMHTCALLRDGTVLCWGSPYHSALGIGPVNQNVTAPTVVPGLPPVSQIAVSGQHTCALGWDGSVWCWGNDETGAVDGVRANFKIVDRPVRVPL